MSYEDIDKPVYGNDVFTNGAEGRYAKAKPPSEKKKRTPKVVPPTTDNKNEHPYENGHYDEVVKTKKKNRKTHQNGETHNEGEENSQVAPSADGETVVKPKKKRPPKAESNNENIDPIPITTGEEPVKKKKSKKPKSTLIDGDSQLIEDSITNELEPTTKVKKSKKHKTPKISADTFVDIHTDISNEYSTNPGIYLFIYLFKSKFCFTI